MPQLIPPNCISGKNDMVVRQFYYSASAVQLTECVSIQTCAQGGADLPLKINLSSVFVTQISQCKNELLETYAGISLVISRGLLEVGEMNLAI